jgi:hypothetical protein
MHEAEAPVVPGSPHYPDGRPMPRLIHHAANLAPRDVNVLTPPSKLVKDVKKLQNSEADRFFVRYIPPER